MPGFAKITIILILFAICSPRLSHGADLTLAWDAPSDGTATGYIIFFGTASAPQSRQVDVGYATSYTVTGLSDGTTYVFSVRAYDATGALSDPSNAVSATTPPMLPEPQPTNLLLNGAFSTGADAWSTFATPDQSHIVWNVNDGVFQFYRQPALSGISQAVLFQQTGIELQAFAPLRATFDLGNSSSVRKRLSVLLVDSDFSDIALCTFSLPPNSPLRPYSIQTHSTEPWSNTMILFSAETAGSDGGFYQVDNVSVEYDTSLGTTSTRCLDPAAPGPLASADSSDLIVNGGFTDGFARWAAAGQIAAQIVNGVFEFVRPGGTPAGVLLQSTGQAVAASEILTSTFHLGNSSSVRKRVTVILHDRNFSDLSACTFWLSPGQPLSAYTFRTFATQAWTNATLSVYPETIGSEQWMRLDDVTLRRTPSASIVGTECIEPDSAR